MPNFVPIRPAVWISIENRHTHRQTDIALYVLDGEVVWQASDSSLSKELHVQSYRGLHDRELRC